ncbi:MAG: hypothetical protein LC791_03205 [Acidobacteria bacterium]|nr:hypothetical protein [Acidobacteriota bacterium]
MTVLLLALTLLVTSSQAATPPSAPVPTPSSADPAAVQFSSPVGLLLVAIKPDKVADYEAVIAALQAALQKSTDPQRRASAQGWRVYKAAETDAKKNVLYVHAIAPTVSGADYRPSLLLDELLQGAPPELMARYRDAFAASPTKLSLTELAHMAVAPVPKD